MHIINLIIYYLSTESRQGARHPLDHTTFSCFLGASLAYHVSLKVMLGLMINKSHKHIIKNMGKKQKQKSVRQTQTQE